MVTTRRQKPTPNEATGLYSKKENWLPAVRQFVILGWTRFVGKSRKAPQITRLRQHICELRTISFRIKSKRRADVRPQGRDGVLPEIREPQRPQRLPMPGFARKDRPGMLRPCHRAESHFSQLLEGQGRPHHYLNHGDGGAEIRWGNFLPKLPRCHNFANFTGRQLGFAERQRS